MARIRMWLGRRLYLGTETAGAVRAASISAQICALQAKNCTKLNEFCERRARTRSSPKKMGRLKEDGTQFIKAQ